MGKTVIKNDAINTQRSTEELRKYYERFAIARESASLGFFDDDPVAGRIEWDERVRDIWGVNVDEPITHQTFISCLHPDDQAAAQAAIEKALDPAGDGKYSAEFRVISRKDGVERWVTATGRAFFDQNRAVRFVGTAQDVTERKRRESNLTLLVELNRDFARLSSAAEIMRAVGSKVAKHMNVSSYVFAEVNEARNEAIVRDAWRSGEANISLGKRRLSEFVADRFLNTARRVEPIIVRGAEDDPRNRVEAYPVVNICAHITVPFYHRGEWKYLFSVGDAIERLWRADEIELIREVTIRTFFRIERAQVEDELRASEARYRGVVENTTAIIFRVDLQGIVRFANGRALEFFGYSAEELIGKPAVGTIVPERETTGRDLAEMVAQIAEGPDRFHSNANENIRKNGERVWLEWTNSGIYDAEGNLKEFLSVGIDATERKRAQERIQQSEARLLEAQRLAKLGDWEWNPKQDHTIWSPGMYDLFSRDRELPAPDREELAQYYTQESWKDLEQAIGKARETGESYEIELEHVREDGIRRWHLAHGEAVRNGLGETLKLRGTAQDITERKRAEEALSDSETKFRLLALTAERLLRSPDPQLVVNEICGEALKVLDCQLFFNYLANESTGTLRLNACAGISDEEVRKIEWLDYGTAVCGQVAQCGQRIVAEDIQHSQDPMTDVLRSHGVQACCCHPLKTREHLIGTLSFGTRTRPRFSHEEVEVMRIMADQVAVAMERMQAEKSLKELNSTLETRVEERIAEINALASQLRGLASELTLAEQRERQRITKVLHDHIQQMLVAAKLQAAALVNQQQNEEAKASLRLVSDLIDRTISASRNLTADLIPPILYDAGLGPALQWLARNFLEKHGLTVEVLFDPSGEPRVEDVRIFLFDAAREILFNVVKHSGVPKAHVKCFRGRDDRVHIVIADDGKGFDPSKLQTGERSEGFGLFSIQQRLRYFGGRLEIESGPERGTRITLIAPPFSAAKQLPLAAVHQRSPVVAKDESKSGKIRIVLADDHHIIRQGLAGLLRSEPDIEVIGEAANGAQAVNMARSLQPDVVVMDVSMPVLNGVEATAEISGDFPGIRIIGLSMHEEGEVSSAILKAGAVAYVTKGGPPEALVAAIRKAVSNRVQRIEGLA